MMQLKRRHMNVLRKLAEMPQAFHTSDRLPDGHGHCAGGHYASGATLRDLCKLELAEVGATGPYDRYGYRITEAGLNAIDYSLVVEVRNGEDVAADKVLDNGAAHVSICVK